VSELTLSTLEAKTPDGVDLGGDWPYAFPHNWRAARGPFTYYLIDADDVVCYVGATSALRSRLKRHALNKTFVRWEAIRQPSWRDALDLESVLFDAFRPYLRNDGTRRS
jgi:hypothetical protein